MIMTNDFNRPLIIEQLGFLSSFWHRYDAEMTYLCIVVQPLLISFAEFL